MGGLSFQFYPDISLIENVMFIYETHTYPHPEHMHSHVYIAFREIFALLIYVCLFGLVYTN